MKILVISDEPSRWLWDFYEKEKLEGVDLILSCGDLPASYLSFLVTMTNVPLLYVNGNHDHYDKKPPEGCICIEDDIFEYKGLRILGLGGSMRYLPGAANQYTETQMAGRIKKMKRLLSKKKGFDILLTHAPARGLGDMDDLPHRGFETFVELLDTYQPRFFFHGHVHMNYGRDVKRETDYKNTRIINAYGKYELEIDE